MAKTKLTKDQLSSLEGVGITGVTTEEEARKILIKKLADNEIDDVDEDPFDELVEMYDAFYEPEEETEEEIEEEEEAEEEEEIEEEEETEEEVEEEEEEEGIDLESLDRSELKSFIKENGLEITIKKSWSDDDIRNAITEALGDDYDDDSNPEEEEYDEAAKDIPEQKKAPAKKEAAKKAPAKKDADKAPSKRGVSFDNENEEHVALLEKGIKKALSGTDTKYELKILKQGTTAYLSMESGRKALFGYDKLRVREDGIHGSFFFQCLQGIEEVKKAVGEDSEYELKEYSRTLIYAASVPLNDLGTLLKGNDLIETLKTKLTAQDKRRVAGRKKMEKNMADEAKAKKPVAEKESTKKVVKAAITKKVADPAEKSASTTKKVVKKVLKKK